MTPQTPNSPSEQSNATLILTIVNRLLLKAFDASTLEALSFVIVNDTIIAIPYDRASMIDFSSAPKVSGVSGQISLKDRSEVSEKLQRTVSYLIDKDKPQLLSESSFAEHSLAWHDLQKELPASFVWLPFQDKERTIAGLLLEFWHKDSATIANTHKETLDILTTSLIPGYAKMWAKFSSKWKSFKKYLTKKNFLYTFLLLLLLLLAIRVPLRIVAPCEVVPQHPLVIAAPLEGIVEHVTVKPGQFVKKGDALIEYDKKAPLAELKAAQKELEINLAEFNRVSTLGLTDATHLAEVGVYRIRVEKAKTQHELAKHQAHKLTVYAPASGVAILQNPEEWSGQPVRIGEKILSIGDPTKSEIKAWIPESDNIVLDLKKNIHVYLNVNPEIERKARLEFIANEITLSDKQVPSFIAEAEWAEPQSDVKLGLKGTAVMYGDRVSLFYFLIRKPLASLRHMTGL